MTAIRKTMVVVLAHLFVEPSLVMPWGAPSLGMAASYWTAVALSKHRARITKSPHKIVFAYCGEAVAVDTVAAFFLMWARPSSPKRGSR